MFAYILVEEVHEYFGYFGRDVFKQKYAFFVNVEWGIMEISETDLKQIIVDTNKSHICIKTESRLSMVSSGGVI